MVQKFTYILGLFFIWNYAMAQDAIAVNTIDFSEPIVVKDCIATRDEKILCHCIIGEKNVERDNFVLISPNLRLVGDKVMHTKGYGNIGETLDGQALFAVKDESLLKMTFVEGAIKEDEIKIANLKGAKLTWLQNDMGIICDVNSKALSYFSVSPSGNIEALKSNNNQFKIKEFINIKADLSCDTCFWLGFKNDKGQLEFLKNAFSPQKKTITLIKDQKDNILKIKPERCDVADFVLNKQSTPYWVGTYEHPQSGTQVLTPAGASDFPKNKSQKYTFSRFNTVCNASNRSDFWMSCLAKKHYGDVEKAFIDFESSSTTTNVSTLVENINQQLEDCSKVASILVLDATNYLAVCEMSGKNSLKLVKFNFHPKAKTIKNIVEKGGTSENTALTIHAFLEKDGKTLTQLTPNFKGNIVLKIKNNTQQTIDDNWEINLVLMKAIEGLTFDKNIFKKTTQIAANATQTVKFWIQTDARFNPSDCKLPFKANIKSYDNTFENNFSIATMPSKTLVKEPFQVVRNQKGEPEGVKGVTLVGKCAADVNVVHYTDNKKIETARPKTNGLVIKEATWDEFLLKKDWYYPVDKEKLRLDAPNKFVFYVEGQAVDSVVIDIRPKAYVLSIGIPDFEEKNKSEKLRFTSNDAQAFAEKMPTLNNRLFHKVNIIKVLSSREETNRDNILTVFETLKDKGIQPEDYLFIHISTHGELRDDQNLYLQAGCCYENSNTWLNWNDVVSKYLNPLACKKIISIDACRKDATKTRLKGNGKTMNDAWLNANAYSNATATIFACSKGESSIELHENHGCFTQAILDTLEELEKIDKPFVSLADFMNLVNQKTNTLLKNIGEEGKQHPIIEVKDVDANQLPIFVKFRND